MKTFYDKLERGNALNKANTTAYGLSVLNKMETNRLMCCEYNQRIKWHKLSKITMK
jgi:hypothetical protein